MAYDPSKDKVITSFEPIEIRKGNEFIVVNLCSWDGGEPKVALLHLYTTKNGETRTSGKIPRLTQTETASLASVLMEAVNFTVSNQ